MGGPAVILEDDFPREEGNLKQALPTFHVEFHRRSFCVKRIPVEAREQSGKIRIKGIVGVDPIFERPRAEKKGRRQKQAEPPAPGFIFPALQKKKGWGYPIKKGVVENTG